MEPENTKATEMIQLAQVQGQLQASTVKHVGELVRSHPEEAVTLIRNMINNEAA
jgi:flagellar M-ring protein FliF